MQSEHAVTTAQRIIRLIYGGAQAFVLMLAGYETTAAALSFTLYLLAANPDKQQLLVDEVDSFGRDRKPSLEDLESLPFLDACLKEGLRLYPPAPTHIREAARDTEIGGYRVRKGQWLGCAMWSMHRNPKYWKVTCHIVRSNVLCGEDPSLIAFVHQRRKMRGGLPTNGQICCETSIGLATVVLNFGVCLCVQGPGAFPAREVHRGGRRA